MENWPFAGTAEATIVSNSSKKVENGDDWWRADTTTLLSDSLCYNTAGLSNLQLNKDFPACWLGFAFSRPKAAACHAWNAKSSKSEG
jgi:hypothetical protein